MNYPSSHSSKSPRAMEIEQLVYFIRTADLQNARQMIATLMGRGERVSREILTTFNRLESGF